MNKPNFTQISPRVLEPRIPELGKIKIGGKGKLVRSRKGKEFRPPVKYDHFVVTTRMRDKETENWIIDQAVHNKVGAKPKELDVRLLFDEPEQNFQYFLAAYDGKSCRCRGNGEIARDREHGEIACPCPLLKQFEGKYEGPPRPSGVVCKPTGRLSVILEAAETYGGFYVFRTTSWETIRSISAQLATYRQQFGFLAGIPMRLVMYPAQDVTPDGTFESYKVAIVVRANMDTTFQLAAAAHEQRKLLPSATLSAEVAELHQQQLLEEEEREAEDIATEFYPETQGTQQAPQAELEQPSEEEKELEEVLRLALETLDWPPMQINRQIAKYAHDLRELEEIVAQKAAIELDLARAEMAKRRAAKPEPEPDATSAAGEPPTVDGEFELEEDGEPEPEPEPARKPAKSKRGREKAAKQEGLELW